jgi:hypothetical protein
LVELASASPDLGNYFKLFRNLGPAIFQFASLESLFAASIAAAGAGAAALAGLVYDIVLEEFDPDFGHEILRVIRACFDEGYRDSFELNLWSLRVMMDSEAFDIEAFAEFELMEFCQYGVVSMKDRLQYPALLVIARLFTNWDLPDGFQATINMLQLTAAFLNCTHESVRVNWLLAVSAIIKDWPEIVDLLHLEGIWQAVLGHFNDGSFDVKRASATFMLTMIAALQPACEILQEIMGADICGFIREVIDLGDETMVKTGLRTLCTVRELLPESDQQITVEILESLVDTDNEALAPYLEPLLATFGSAFANPPE